eukprot:Nitzschia sp. Nitz4//scaffold8_size234185//212185//213402//NITZ4_001300-RA/size234185-processed-gene-0.407-mRNA-1//-1//CDS//3329559935//9109//frame0
MVSATQDRRRTAPQPLQQVIVEWLFFILRIALWPLQKMGDYLLPPGEFDGLAPAVGEKASQQFVHRMSSLASNDAQQAAIASAFSTLGYATLKQEAAENHALLVVLLYSPIHHHTDRFLEQMVSPAMLEFFGQHNVKALGSSIHTSQGASLAIQVGASSYPLFAMLQAMPNSETVKLLFKAEGPTLQSMKVQDLMPLIKGTHQRFGMLMAEEVARRMEREQEVELRRQQDLEYQQALEADQQRERQRQEEQAEQERVLLQAQEEERQKEQAEAQRLDRARALLRPAPSTGGTRIRFVLPSGKKLDRRFEKDESVASLKAFLTLHFAEEQPEIRNIGLSTSFPKNTYDDDSLVLGESDLVPQAVLMVQDLDA